MAGGRYPGLPPGCGRRPPARSAWAGR